MRKAILISLVLTGAIISFGQSASNKSRQKTSVKQKTPHPIESRCGVQWKSAEEFLKEIHSGWKFVSATDERKFYFNAEKEICGANGVLKVWIKAIDTDESYSLQRYELKCRDEQLRRTSAIKYSKEHRLIESDNLNEPWRDTVPDSIGESILQSVCHRTF